MSFPFQMFLLLTFNLRVRLNTSNQLRDWGEDIYEMSSLLQ